MKKAWAIWVVAICFTACFDLPQEVKEALELAGKNLILMLIVLVIM